MTVARHSALSRFSQDIAIDALYEQVLALEQANQDTSCAGLQKHFRIGYDLALQLQKRLENNGALHGIESHLEPKKVCVRVVDVPDSPAHALVELVACDASGNRYLVTTSAPMPRDAAKAIARLYDKADDIPPTFQSIKAVLGQTGQAAWACAASSASNAAKAAALEACADIKARGFDLSMVGRILVVTTLTPESKFIDVIKTVLNTVRLELQPGARMATAIVIDDALAGQVQVQLLVAGL